MGIRMKEEIKKLKNQCHIIESTLNNIESYVFTKDLNGCYTYVNDKVAELFQRKKEDIIGYDDSHFFDLDMSNEIIKNDLKVLKEGLTIQSEEQVHVKSIGELRTCTTVKKPIYDHNQKIIGMSGISSELTEIAALEAIVEEQQNLLDIILDNVDAYIYMKDSTRHFRYVNSKVANLFGKPLNQIIGYLDSEVIPKEFADHFWESDKKVFETNKPQTIEENIADEDGVLRRYISTKIPYQFNDKSKALIGFSTDITELHQLKEKFKSQASLDSLTNIHNRRYFFDNAVKEYKRALRHELPLSLILIDIDYFKLVNDKYGHPAGDKVIIDVVEQILPSIRTHDVFARVGGEEFAILLPNTSNAKAFDVAQRLCKGQAQRSLMNILNEDLKVTLSFGVASVCLKQNSFDDLYSCADEALYKAKIYGRNQVQNAKQ